MKTLKVLRPLPGADELGRIYSILMAVQLARTHDDPVRQRNAEAQARKAIEHCRLQAERWQRAIGKVEEDKWRYHYKHWSWRANNLEYLLQRAQGLMAEPPLRPESDEHPQEK